MVTVFYIFIYILLLLVAYIIGSIPVGYICALINELTHSSDIDSVERNIHEWCDNDTTEYQKIELALKLSHYITNYLLSLEK